MFFNVKRLIKLAFFGRETFTLTTGSTTVTAGLEQTFTQTTENGVDTYIAKDDIFSGLETTIAVSAVMQATVGSDTVSSVAATIADLDIDTTAPEAPTVNAIEGNGVVNFAEAADGIQVTGTAEAGSTVSVYMGGTTKTATAGNDGAYSVTFSGTEVPVDGSYGVDVKATDAAGNESGLTSPNITIDTDADIGNNLSITIATDNEVTNLAESTAVAFTLAGIDSDAASVAVTFADSATPTAGTVTVNATQEQDGSWTVDTADLTGLKDGAVKATVTVTDIAGNTAEAEDTLTLATTPAKVSSVELTAKSETNFAQLNAGDVVTATVTMDSAVTVVGIPTLTLVIGNDEVQATYDSISQDGKELKFNYTILAEKTDTDGISIKAGDIVLGDGVSITDDNDNSATLTFTEVAANASYKVDTTAPTAVATITALSADTSADGNGNNDFNTNEASQTVSGTYTGTLVTDEKIQVSVDGTNWVDATANTGDSTWTTAANAITLVAGEDKVLGVRIIDAAGNVSWGDDKSYTLDTTAPTVTVSGIDISEDTGVSDSDFNTTDDEQTITATLSTGLGDGETLWGSVDGGSTWTDISAINGAVSGTAVSWDSTLIAKTESNTPEIQFEVRDAAGNAGTTETQAYVLDTTLSNAEVTISELLDDVGAITGDMLDANITTTDDTKPTLVITLTNTLAADESIVVYDTYDGTTTRLGVATLDTIENSLTNGKYLFTPNNALTEDSNHTLTHTLKAVVEDTAGNQSTGSSFANLSIDTTSPTTAVSITAVADNTGEDPTSGDTTSDTSLTVSGNFGGEAAGAELGTSEKLYIYDGEMYLGEADVTTASGSQSTWSYTDDRALTDTQVVNYIAKLTNTTTGTQGTPSNTFNITIDTTAPTVSITSSVAEVKIGETATITFTFSEVPVGFAVGDVTVTGGTLSDFAVDSTDSKKYTAIFTPNVDTEGSANITIAQGTYTDAAANNGAEGIIPTLTIDTKAPTAPTNVALAAVGGTEVSNTLNTTNTNLTVTATIVSNEVTGGHAELYIGSKMIANSADLGNDTVTFTAIANPSTNALQEAITAGGNVTVKLYDAAGNVITSAPTSLTVDYLPPATPNAVLTTDSFGGTGTNSDNYTNSGAITAPENAEAMATVEYRLKKDADDFGSWGTSYSAPATDGSVDGAYVVEVRQTDAAGNVSATQTISYTLDTKVAVPTITGLTNDTGASGVANVTTDKTTKDMTLSLGGVEDGALVEYSIDSGNNWLSESAYLALVDGTYSVVVRQTDKAGNQSKASNALEGIVKDTLAPATVTFTIVDGGTNESDGVTSNNLVNISKADDVVMWEYTLNGTAATPTWVTGTGTQFSLGTTDANFAIGDIQVRGYDLAGNMTPASSNTMAYRLDKTAPMAASPVSVKHYDLNGVEKTGDYIAGDFIEFLFNEQLSASPTKSAGDGFGNTASINLNDTATGALVQLKSSEAIDVGDKISLQAIDLVGLQSTIEFTLI